MERSGPDYGVALQTYFPLSIRIEGGEVRLQGPALRAGPLPTPRGSDGGPRASHTRDPRRIRRAATKVVVVGVRLRAQWS